MKASFRKQLWTVSELWRARALQYAEKRREMEEKQRSSRRWATRRRVSRNGTTKEKCRKSEKAALEYVENEDLEMEILNSASTLSLLLTPNYLTQFRLKVYFLC